MTEMLDYMSVRLDTISQRERTDRQVDVIKQLIGRHLCSLNASLVFGTPYLQSKGGMKVNLHLTRTINYRSYIIARLTFV